MHVSMQSAINLPAGWFDPTTLKVYSDATWAMERLQRALESGAHIDPEHMAIEWLAENAAVSPSLAVESLAALVETSPLPWFPTTWMEQVRMVLEVADDSNDPTARLQAKALAEKFVSLGLEDPLKPSES